MTEEFNPADFFGQHVEHGSAGTKTRKTTIAKVNPQTGQSSQPRTGLSDGARAQIAAGVAFFDHAIKMAGHQLTPEQHEQLRKHAHGFMTAHFDPQNAARVNHYNLTVRGASKDHPSFTVSVGNVDRSDHHDVHVTSTAGHDFKTEVKDLSSKASLGDFTGAGKVGEPITQKTRRGGKVFSSLIRYLRQIMTNTPHYDVHLKPSSQRTLLRKYEKETHRKGSGSITVVNTDPTSPWNSGMHHFALTGPRARLSNTDFSSWIRHQVRGAHEYSTSPATFHRRYVQSIGNIPAFQRAVSQAETLDISHLFMK